MAGRSRTNVPATIYKDFQPRIERKEEEGANILIIHLPDFPKEQINVTYVESTRSIKVQAERAVVKNTRSRFNQVFPVPENCIIEKIQGAFRNGVLTITIPKRTITQLQVDSPKDVNISKETTPPKPITEPKPPMAAAPQTAASPKERTKGKKVEALAPLKQQEETQKRVSPIGATAMQTEEKTGGSTSIPEIVEKRGETKDGLMDLIKEKESGAVEKKPKEGGGRGGSGFLEKAKEMKGMDTIMKTVKRLATDDHEDRQLLINIGVSVLVIVALGAYITYSYRSSRKD